jgi:hypothetical protein
VPTERLRQGLDAVVLDQRISAASTPERAGFGAFISSLLSFETRAPLGYASLAVVLAFAAIFGYVKLTTTTPPQAPVVAVAPPKVEQVPVKVPVAGNNTETNRTIQNTNSQAINSRPANRATQTPRFQQVKATVNPTNPAPTSEPVKLLPGERSYLQTIARLDTTIKANQKSMRPSLQVEYERNLAVVDRAIAATRSAAKSNPNDSDAADFMFAAYQSKVDFLNTIADARLGGGRSH